MTAVWGPLGWMTLHSVATSFPEAPTPSERQLMSSWLDLFRDTITCPTCRDHFTGMLANYRLQFPGMLSSRNDFAVFSFRAHNEVNRRIHKPIYSTVAECMELLQKNTTSRTARDYRLAYLNHIQRYYRTLRDAAGIAALRKIQEMYKVENEYMVVRDTLFKVSIPETTVILHATVLNRDPDAIAVRPTISPTANLGRFRITPTGIRIQR
jgi:Erv1 / Alr family